MSKTTTRVAPLILPCLATPCHYNLTLTVFVTVLELLEIRPLGHIAQPLAKMKTKIKIEQLIDLPMLIETTVT